MYPRHNDIIESKDHYISYNFADRSVYGTDTTAIVIGQMQRFYILKGDHTEYLKDKNFKQCMEYFQNNIGLKHPFSDNYDEKDALNIINDYKAFKLKRGYK